MNKKENKKSLFLNYLANSKLFANRYLWSFILIVLSIFFIYASFVNKELITTFHSYTFGFWFGLSSYLIYAIVFGFGIWLLISNKIKKKNIKAYRIFKTKFRITFWILLALIFGLGITLWFDFSENKLWFFDKYYEHNFFIKTINWIKDFKLDSWIINANVNIFETGAHLQKSGLLFIILFDILSLSGSNTLIFFIVLLLFIYIVLIIFYKWPLKMIFSKNYRKYFYIILKQNAKFNYKKIKKKIDNLIYKNTFKHYSDNKIISKLKSIFDENLIFVERFLKLDDEYTLILNRELTWENIMAIILKNEKVLEDEINFELEMSNNKEDDNNSLFSQEDDTWAIDLTTIAQVQDFKNESIKKSKR